MAFPVNPSDNELYTNNLGTEYKYVAADTKWIINSQEITGATGAQGETGLPGVGGTGLQGETGLPGSVGETGASGIGETGLQGETGLRGFTGAEGTAGDQGETGAEGTVGSQGETGAEGTAGTTGLQGETGIAYVVSGTSSPPDPSGYSDNTIYFQYVT